MHLKDARIHVLLVDDDDLLLSAFEMGLEDAGYEVSTACDGTAALTRMQEHKPDLAVVDISMPGMSGLDLAAELASNQVPFIFLSGHAGRDIAEQARRAGALGYLVKPILVPQIIPTLEQALVLASRIDTLEAKSENLRQALGQKRDTSIAIGILMARGGHSRQKAFEALRVQARSEQRPVSDVAEDLIESIETLNETGQALSQTQ